jgi:(2Fe-2S) ferredoxin
MSFKAHLFICTNKKDGKTCCADKGSEALRARLKDWAKAEFGKQDVRINASGCLDRCAEGITAVLYPQNIWLTEIKADDDEKLKTVLREALGKG